jgi:hypothetical protein
MKVPVYEQPLDESLTLAELIQTLNSERAVMRAPSPPLKWADIAGVNEAGEPVFWRDVPLEQRPADKQHVV